VNFIIILRLKTLSRISTYSSQFNSDLHQTLHTARNCSEAELVNFFEKIGHKPPRYVSMQVRARKNCIARWGIFVPHNPYTCHFLCLLSFLSLALFPPIAPASLYTPFSFPQHTVGRNFDYPSI